jgi:hypothetical protein
VQEVLVTVSSLLEPSQVLPVDYSKAFLEEEPFLPLLGGLVTVSSPLEPSQILPVDYEETFFWEVVK